MVKYLIKVQEKFDVSNLTNLGEITYYDLLNNVLFFKTDRLASELLRIEGVSTVEESRIFKVGI